MRVLVVGAGVVGLTCAVRLLEEGHRVDVLARDLPLETTSAVAAALWYPYRAYPFERVTAWAARSYEVFAGLAEREAGVALRPGTEVFATPPVDPWWVSAVPSLERVAEVPTPYAGGLSFVAPVVEMPVYLRWLQARVEALGGTVTRMALQALPEHADAVVNAAGLGARLTAQDTSVLPVRGQVVLVSQVGLDRWWLDSSGPTYVVPRAHDIVVGGTDEEGHWDRKPSDVVAKDILDRATQLVPALGKATVLGHRVGLRPARASVRLEREGHVVHCYGHGGAGVTLSWGCADEVAGLLA
ncbi:MAG TPA: FAD-dependent oxidoreductase [Nocardioidaceae bacterium]|nr:FAD-dependent oxidoreductase [Nocardioidaceae bacterium]